MKNIKNGIGDKETFEAFLDILPEQNVSLSSSQIYHGCCSDSNWNMLLDYQNYNKEGTLDKFEDLGLNKIYKKFVESFTLLWSFMCKYFGDGSDRRIDSFPWRLGEEKNRKELQKLVKNFNKEYKFFIEKANEKLYPSAKIPSSITMQKNKKIKMIKLPSGTKWEDITIRFLNPYDIKIFVKNKIHSEINNEDMGCFLLNKKDKEADLQWKFLKELSVSEGECDLQSKGSVHEKDKYKQYKRKLSLRLKKLFDTNEDPFYRYKDKNIYKTKFKIEPEPNLRGDGEIYGIKEDDGRYNDIHDEIERETRTRENHKTKIPPSEDFSED